MFLAVVHSLSFCCLRTTNNALVFNQSATDVDNYGFNEKFSLTKTLASICNSGGTTANNSDLLKVMRAMLNREMRIKLVLKDIRFILNFI
jgi:hypothetical protein